MRAVRRVQGTRGQDARRCLSLILALVMSVSPVLLLAPEERGAGAPDGKVTRENVLNAFHSTDAYFTENRGQVAEPVRFYSGGNPAVGFRDDGVMFVMKERMSGNPESEGPRIDPSDHSSAPADVGVTISTSSYMVRFEGAQAVRPVGLDELAFKSNFFYGNDSSTWRTGVPNFAGVAYLGLYPGIDLVYRQAGGAVKYEFTIHPGADPRSIRLSYEGVKSARIEGASLIAVTSVGQLSDSAPYSYQSAGGEVGCAFAMRGQDLYGFDCGDWDRSADLIIDPMIYSTFLGGMDDNQFCSIEQGDMGESIATDETGAAYVFGGTCSLDFPVTPGAFNTTYWYHPVQKTYWFGPRWEGADARQMFVAKLNPEGTALVYATYLGGMGQEMAYSIAVDPTGNAYLTGSTMSQDYPVTPGAYDTTFDCYSGVVDLGGGRKGVWEMNLSEVFITKLNPMGSTLVYSTFLGTKDSDFGYSIAIDSAGSAYVTGETNSSKFPVTPGAYDTTANSNGTFTDAFVAKLSPAGDRLIYSTYLGGALLDWGSSIAVDSGGNAYIAGPTNSPSFPTTPGAFDRTLNGAMDIFVTKLNAAGSNVVYSTLLGGNDTEYRVAVTVDAAGNAYLAGETRSPDFPITPGVFRPIGFGKREGFVTKLNTGGTGLVYSTFLGGNSDIDSATSIAVDLLGNAYVTGQTYSADFPITKGAFDSVFSDREGYLTKLNADATALLYSTFLGGSGAGDIGMDVAVDTSGIAYVTGWTNSSDFPTTSRAFDTTFCNYTDAFAVKFNPVIPLDPPNLQITPWGISFNPSPPIVTGNQVTVTARVRNTGGTSISQAVVRFFEGPPSNNVRIDGDQRIPFLLYLTGEGNVSVTWTSGPPATYSICVFVDPDNNINESYETDNQACKPIAVVQPMPDLEITSADIVLTPASPMVEATDVTIKATVRNVGAAASGSASADFRDGVPPSPLIGTRIIPPLAIGGSAVLSVQWIASPWGPHRICVVVDPGNAITELNETNNMACLNISVLPPPDLTPSWIAVAPTPPLLVGTKTWLNVTVINIGESAAVNFDVVLFDDLNGNSLPDSGENISLVTLPRLNPHTQTIVPFTWSASPAGIHRMSVYVDPPPGRVHERIEQNNFVSTTIEVQAPITTRPDYVPTSPQPSPTSKTGISMPVDLSIQILNQGNESATVNATLAFYNETPPAQPFAKFVVQPLNESEVSPRFIATWISPSAPGTYRVSADVDYDGNVSEWNETNNVFTWTIEVVSGPVTSLVIGTPNVSAGMTYVTSATLLGFIVRDQSGVGIRRTMYRIDSGTWENHTAKGDFSLTVEGEHTIEWYSEDFARNTESVGSRSLRVDNTPPASTIRLFGPTYQSGSLFVTNATSFNLTTAEGGLMPVGLATLEYRIDGGQWTSYTDNFLLSGNDGQRVIDYRATDLLGNIEAAGSRTVILDNTPPATAISPAVDHATTDTLFTLEATDAGCGVRVTQYRIDRGSLRSYSSAFNLSAGEHNITYYSIDMLGNQEAERTRHVFVLNATSTLAPEANYKPVLAMLFAITLLVAGVWSSRRRPWKGGKDGMAVAKAFMITSISFVLAEIATGLISSATGQLSIPPAIGFGTAVDVTILLTGLGAAVVRVLRVNPQSAGTQDEA